jgi:arginyl-tRNA synthetase
MLALKGNTAPYLLNAYVRTRAIFRKLGSDYEPASEISLTDDAERTLTLKLAQFAEIVPTVLDDFRPNALAQYLYDVATTYHKFWEACPVLKAEGAIRDTRLALCELTGRILRCGLGLLGIRTTEKM